MDYTGVLSKMQTQIHENNIAYFLLLEENFLHVNQLINKTIHLEHLGYSCLGCAADTILFRQGYCKKCFFKNPALADWVMKPELSKAHLNIAHRDLAYEKSVQLQPHIVYIALTSGAKVGVTRKSQIPVRWIDQGAVQALKMLEVHNRYLAGIAEVALKKYLSDKTSWRKMLRCEVDFQDLKTLKRSLKTHVPDEVKKYFLEEDEIYHFSYPLLKIPEKPKSLPLKPNMNYQGTLKGIKGQYLIFEDGTVLNVRSNAGNTLRFRIS